ncbi:unnamed protein product [Diatraea saccharalis]|uniref:Uncharacterized protein n=1 Tax=Diatraea saccharalis TaxID=40085 RepID=A0A9N9WCF5_9NEOP|nr:unnamed protein product [Diatraea saccharalis]
MDYISHLKSNIVIKYKCGIIFQIVTVHPIRFIKPIGGFPSIIGNVVKKSTEPIDNKHAFKKKLRLDNKAAKDWFQRSLVEVDETTGGGKDPRGLHSCGDTHEQS